MAAIKKSTPKSNAAAVRKAAPAASSKKPAASAKTAACACAKANAKAKAKAAPAPAAAVTPVITVPQPRRVTFTVRADAGSSVSVAGSFNQWDATANLLTDPTGTGIFSTEISLLPGSYEYKFVINGTWCVDPECIDWVQNNLGTLNSVCKV